MSEFFAAKDLAMLWHVHPDTVRRWAKRAGVSATLPAFRATRWSAAAAQRIIKSVAKTKGGTHDDR